MKLRTTMQSDSQRTDRVSKLRADIVTYALGEELVVLLQEHQLVLGLNASAAFIFRELERGSGEVQIAQALVFAHSITRSEAESWVAATIKDFGTHGLFESDELSGTA